MQKDNTPADYAKVINVVMPTYNLIELSDIIQKC